jgi:hypothetical protein
MVCKCIRRYFKKADPKTEVLTHILSHLPAASLSAVSLVSRRFYNLVTTPHAWRVAFSRFFPGQDAVDNGNGNASQSNRRGSDQEARDHLRAEQRFFTRLTALASWRSEYILRTRLLRSLTRGKPQQPARGPSGSNRANNAVHNANAVMTYNSQLFSTVSHIHAVFDNGKKGPRFIHGADDAGTACLSDPTLGKVGNWGLSDPQSLPQFSDLFPGDTMYGLGDGLVVGTPNVMDVSQPFGMVYGEGFPGGQAYFRSSEEMKGRFLSRPAGQSEPQAGIPKVPESTDSICAVWIAKSSAVPSTTDGLVGIMTGSSSGIATTYSLGADNLRADNPRNSRLQRGEITARWVLSPGVPIISLSVDESYNIERKAAGRIWAVALNALGEVFYLTDSFQRANPEIGITLTQDVISRLAWDTGRNAAWKLVEGTRRIAREDPYKAADFDGSYSPKSFSKNMKLSKEQLATEARELETFIKYRPAHFQKVCEGWDMQRLLEVDFAGDDGGNGAGENIIVIRRGIPGSDPAQVKRFTRMLSQPASSDNYPAPKLVNVAFRNTNPSLFGGGPMKTPASPATSSSPVSLTSSGSKPAMSSLVEEWRSSILGWQGSQSVEVSTSAIDSSTYALLGVSEDPIIIMNGDSSASSAFSTPLEVEGPSVGKIPGYRARFIAVGTKSGTVFVWNMRGPHSSNPAIVNELQPIRSIHTDSPQISCLALSALYLVHGGNDGLVQAWDPLASTLQPIRTLHSRFSSRARRRLIQAEASVQGVGINLYAAGAIVLDPDATALRGMVSLGTHLRYWAYSSTAADEVSSKKRRLRRSQERGNNGSPDKYIHTGRGALMDYIANEQEDLKKEKERREREQERLHGRFGVGLAGLTEEEALRLAEMVSQESFMKDEERRLIDSVNSPPRDITPPPESAWSSNNVTPEGSVIAGPVHSPYIKDDELDRDLEEAIRLSLLDGVNGEGSSPPRRGSSDYDVLFVVKKKQSRRSPSTSPSTSQASKNRRRRAGKQKESIAVDDLDFALQLSLAEEQSRQELLCAAEEFPELESSGKGKGKAI